MADAPEPAFKKPKAYVMPPSIARLRFGIRLVLVQFLIVAICFLGWILWHFNEENVLGKWIQVIVPVAGFLSTIVGMVGMGVCFAAPAGMSGKGNLVAGLVFYFLVLIVEPVLAAAAMAGAIGLPEDYFPAMQWAAILNPIIYISAIWVFWLLGSVFFLVFLFRLSEFFENEELMNRTGDLVKRGILLAIWVVFFAALFAVWFMVIVHVVLITFMSVLYPVSMVFPILFFFTIFFLVLFIVQSMQAMGHVRDGLGTVTEDQLDF